MAVDPQRRFGTPSYTQWILVSSLVLAGGGCGPGEPLAPPEFEASGNVQGVGATSRLGSPQSAACTAPAHLFLSGKLSSLVAATLGGSALKTFTTYPATLDDYMNDLLCWQSNNNALVPRMQYRALSSASPPATINCAGSALFSTAYLWGGMLTSQGISATESFVMPSTLDGYLASSFVSISAGQAVKGDIVRWKDASGNGVHYATWYDGTNFFSKTGNLGFYERATLSELSGIYGTNIDYWSVTCSNGCFLTSTDRADVYRYQGGSCAGLNAVKLDTSATSYYQCVGRASGRYQGWNGPYYRASGPCANSCYVTWDNHANTRDSVGSTCLGVGQKRTNLEGTLCYQCNAGSGWRQVNVSLSNCK